MQTVKAKRDDLLVRLRKNRGEHRELFNKAQEGFRKQVIEHLDKMLADAKEGRKIRLAVALPEPIDQTKDYDRVITMLEMSVDDVVELTQGEFAQYVMDDWQWKQNVFATNTRYT